MKQSRQAGRSRRRQSGYIGWMAVAGLLPLAACEAAQVVDAARVTRRDSAGIEIAEIQGDPWNAAVWAHLDTTRVFRITPDEARPETLFGSIQDALRLADGRIVVLDRRRYQLLLFGPDGAPLRSIGRRGQGPAEFQFPTRLLRARGDSVGVADGAHVEIFSLATADARRVTLPAADSGHRTQAFGVLANGLYLTIRSRISAESRVGRNVLYASIGSVAADGTPGRMLGRHVAGEFTYRSGGADGLMEVMTLFWADPAGAVLPDGYVWCLSVQFDCQVWSLGKGHVRTIRSATKPRAVTDADVDALTTDWLQGLRTRSDSLEMRRFIWAADRTERMPVLSELRTDARGQIWMRAYAPDGNVDPVRWLVFDATGRVLGTVTTPAGLHVLDIGDDYLLGAERDADDAHGIVMYRYSVRR